LQKRKIGLALSSGAVRGLAHIGVLEVLQKEGIPIDMLAGTSAGALIGAVYAQGKEANSIKDEVLELDWKRLASLVDLALPKTGFIGGKKIANLLRTFIGGDIKFGDLKIPFSVVATDIITGEEVVIKEGSVLEAVRASISIPVLFTVAKWQDRYLVDGGLVNPVPVSVLREMGADFIIAVNAIPDLTGRTRHMGKEGTKDHKEPNIFNVIMHTVYMGTYALVRSCLEDADVVISPQVAHIGYFDYHRAQECILKGELAAQDSILEIKRRLELKGK